MSRELKKNGAHLSWALAAVAAVALLITFLLPSRRGLAGVEATSPKNPVVKTQKPQLRPEQLAHAASIGAWTTPASLCASDNTCVVGIDAALTYTGQVMFYQYPRFNGGQNSLAVSLNPTTGAVTDVSLPFNDDIFCSGLTIMQDGTVMVAGGNDKSNPRPNAGEPYTTFYNPATLTWTQGNNMANARWYPSLIGLQDGTSLVMTGENADGTGIVLPMESYNPSTGNWTTLPASADVPTAIAQPYPRLALLPNGNVVDVSPAAQTYAFTPSTNTWSFVATMNFGIRYYNGHVLLPGLEKILVAGGTPTTFTQPMPATNTVETIDFSQTTPAWSYTTPMNFARIDENLVLLPNSQVLAVGGGCGNGKYTCPVETPEVYQPSTATWTNLASDSVNRTYHSTALLLPDDRVLSAGSDNGSTQTMTYEIFSPPYLFQGTQPTITSPPTTLTYNTKFKFGFTVQSGASIKEVALMRPGATTHADNFDQRKVGLTFSVLGSQITATAPPDANHAPPGYYMLVIVDSKGVPSVMPFVLVN